MEIKFSGGSRFSKPPNGHAEAPVSTGSFKI